MAPSISSEKRELRRLALAHLTKSAAADEARRFPEIAAPCDRGQGEPQAGESGGQETGEGEEGQALLLPPNLHDLDQILEKTPLLREDNAFHDTLNHDNAISCPFVLSRPGLETEGLEAVVRFGKSIAGHPKIVHGGVTALTFDNLFGVALFMNNTGAVFTAYIKVDYKAPLPCLTTAVVDVTIDRKEGRKLFVTGRLKSLDGTITYSSAEALFIKPREAAPETSGGGDSGLLQEIAR